MARDTIAARIKKKNCEECRRLAAGITRHAALDDVFLQHKKGHGSKTTLKRSWRDNEEEEDNEASDEDTRTPRRKVDREKDEEDGGQDSDAEKEDDEVLKGPPNEATSKTHSWQGPFIQILWDEMPENDKLDPMEAVVIDAEVTRKALEVAVAVKTAFWPLTGESYGEENDRPPVTGLVAGLVSLVGETQVKAENSPVEYYVERLVEGKMISVKCSSLGKSEAMETSLEHGDDPNRKWKMDVLLHSLIRVDGKKVWVPRILVEAKGDDAKFQDMFQASTNGLKVVLKLLQGGKTIDRLYLEVWGTQVYFYGILDVFGYITLKDGIVTQGSFERYQATVEKRKTMLGHQFPSDSYRRCPQTIVEMQKMYNAQARNFYGKYHCHLHGQEDFPIGVVYLAHTPHAMPTGHLRVIAKEASRFVQAHARILGSDESIQGTSLSKNIQDFWARVSSDGLDMVFQAKPLPAPIYKLIPEVEASDSDMWNHPPAKEDVRRWEVSDVARFFQRAGMEEYANCVKTTGIDGSLLLVMNESNLDQWLGNLGMKLREQLLVKRWWLSMKNTEE